MLCDAAGLPERPFVESSGPLTPAPASIPLGNEPAAFGTQLSDPVSCAQLPEAQGQRPHGLGTAHFFLAIGLK